MGNEIKTPSVSQFLKINSIYQIGLQVYFSKITCSFTSQKGVEVDRLINLSVCFCHYLIKHFWKACDISRLTSGFCLLKSWPYFSETVTNFPKELGDYVMTYTKLVVFMSRSFESLASDVLRITKRKSYQIGY